VKQIQTIQGRSVSADEIQWLAQWIGEHPQWSRKRIARELCLRWDWRDELGRLKDFAARSFLLKLEARSQLTLPPLRIEYRSQRRPPPQPTSWREPSPWQASLEQLAPLSIELVTSASKSAAQWAFLLNRYHYLGLHVIGENLGYLVRDTQGREVACLLFGAAAWRCAARDLYLGWVKPEARQLSRIANNTRFLIPHWVRVPHLASHVLSRVTRGINADWQTKYGHALDWLETFIETPRFTGACYRAANWRRVGQSRGRTRQDRYHQIQAPTKDIYLYALGK
jgi:hypothetical protein